MIRLFVFGLVLAIGLLAFAVLSGKRERPIDVDPVDSSSKRREKPSKANNDDIIDVDPIEL